MDPTRGCAVTPAPSDFGSPTRSSSDLSSLTADLQFIDYVLIVLSALVAGVMNSIAGGGTLLTFPALVGIGVPPIVANATSTVALWPGVAGSLWGYRRELSGVRQWAISIAVPSALGGIAGALLLLVTPADRFDRLIPWLVIGASVLFTAQRPLMRHLKRSEPDGDPGHEPARPSLPVLVYQFLVSVYGGYFGAGIGILMLAALGYMGFTNIHRMNGLKNWGALCINLVAAVTFTVSSVVDWRVALAMATGATIGGYGGSRLAQRVRQEYVRRAIVVIGFGSGLWLLVERGW
jgi:uncharacterized protein